MGGLCQENVITFCGVGLISGTSILGVLLPVSLLEMSVSCEALSAAQFLLLLVHTHVRAPTLHSSNTLEHPLSHGLQILPWISSTIDQLMLPQPLEALLCLSADHADRQFEVIKTPLPGSSHVRHLLGLAMRKGRRQHHVHLHLLKCPS